MTKMIFGALVASIAIGLVGIALAESPTLDAKSRKQKPAKLNLSRVSASLRVGPNRVSPIVDVSCPRRHRVVSGSVSPGATFVAVSAPTPGEEGWSAAVGNAADFTANWRVDVICARAGNRYLRVNRGRFYRAQKAQYRAMKRQLERRLR